MASHPERPARETERSAEGRVLVLVLVAVLVTYTAQQLLTPVLAPLSREVGLTEFQLGLVITVAAVVFTLASLAWGRVADRWGHRRVLLTGLVLAAAGMAAFTVVCRWALAGGQAPEAVLLAMLLTRSVLFGIGVGAVPVAALSYVGSTTAGAEARTRAVSMVGAAQAVSLVLGPGLGGALAVVDLLAPVHLAPVLLVVAAVVVAALLPRAPRTAAAVDEPRPVRSVAPWDARVRPFLVVGFLLYLSLGMMQVIIGFLVQDRLGSDSRDTAVAVGVAFFATGLVLVATQAVVVPRLRWAPAPLLRVGSPIAAAGFVVLALAAQLWSITAGMAIIALGLGLAMPGFSAGASLRVGPTEQGAVAGLVNATTGATFVLGPLLGTGLYTAAPALPIWLGAATCVVGACVAGLSRGVVAAPTVSVVQPPGPES
ncbi:MFS transporter [Pseudonocardia humida]|uniref:MFS transporter n=1 Tax=Pseudonocardia humida TaxID=2800819 RepID=A0ABT0ZWN9_9PSEU|nr:MFS transporter [Pseudonocardia humida]MCO1655157.1 MFS transporter [Pseudonocardia humida]